MDKNFCDWNLPSRQRLAFYQNVWLLLFYIPPENLVFIHTVDAIECWWRDLNVYRPILCTHGHWTVRGFSVPVTSVLKGHLWRQQSRYKKRSLHLHKSRNSDIVSTQCLDKSHYRKVGLEDCHEVCLLLSANQSEWHFQSSSVDRQFSLPISLRQVIVHISGNHKLAIALITNL